MASTQSAGHSTHAEAIPFSSTTSNSNSRAEKVGTWLHIWGPLAAILLVAMFMRVGYMPVVGHPSDILWNLRRSNAVARAGLFQLYATKFSDYPPVYMAVLGTVGTIQKARGGEILAASDGGIPDDPFLIAMLKVIPLLCDLATISVVYVWLRKLESLKPRWLRWALPLGLALAPALILDSSSWGQSDSVMGLLLILVLIALSHDRPLYAWAFFGLAMITKVQSVAILPILGILCLRRYGWRKTAIGIAITAAIMIVALTPFIIYSGFTVTMYPYFGVVGDYPNISVNAFNSWYAFSPHPSGTVLNWPDNAVLDSDPIFGPVTFRQLGLGMLALYALLLVVDMWRRPEQHREFMWGAAIYFAFFMLPTEVHERYLYPGALFLIIAIAQDRRVWWLALLTAYTFAYNLVLILQTTWLGAYWWSRNIAVQIALINILVFAELTRYTLTSPQTESATPKRITRWMPILSRGMIALLLVSIGYTLIMEAWTYLPTSQWLKDHVAAKSQIVTERLEVVNFTKDSPDAQTWYWGTTATAEDKPVAQWLGEGNHYIILDEKTNTGVDFHTREVQMIDQGATLLYESSGTPWRQAIFWTFSPQHPVSVTFHDSLQLVGYDIVPNGAETDLLMYWYTVQTSPTDYNIFLHFLSRSDGSLVGQTDGPLGKGVHPSSTWRKNEIVFEWIPLPADILANHACDSIVQMGLYRLDNGERAAITQGGPGDHIDFDLSSIGKCR